MKYVFEKVLSKDLENGFIGGSKIGSLCDLFDSKKEALVYGQLQKLFGQAEFVSNDYEEMYTYNIRATDENGKSVYFYAYSGPTGPSIGGNTQDEDTVKAATALIKELEATEPLDYEHECIYLDVGSKITLGVKNGVPYFNEESSDISELGDVFM